MVIANEKFTITVAKLLFDPERTNEHTINVVNYGPGANVVFVDERAPQEYLDYAIAHEVVLRNKNSEFCGVPLPDPKDPTRRREIDRILLEWGVIPESEREQYARRHIEMMEYVWEQRQEMEAVDYCRIYLETWLQKHTGKKTVIMNKTKNGPLA